MARVPALPRVDRLASRAGRGLYEALTPRTNEPSGGIPPRQNTSQYARAFASTLDPRTREGLFNLSMFFVPGPKGGFVGKGRMTESQKNLVKKLGNIRATPLEPNPLWYEQRGLTPERVHEHELKQDLWSMIPNQRDKALMDMIELLGVPRGNPLQNLRMQAGTRGLNKPDFELGKQKLGQDPGGTRPDWVVGQKWRDTIRDFPPTEGRFDERGRYIPARTDPNVTGPLHDQWLEAGGQGWLHNATQEQMEALERVLRVMRRRGQPGS